MRLEENDLSESLHRLVPDPPRLLTVEDVARRAADGQTQPTRHRRPWLSPLLVAATVIVVVAAAVSIVTVVRTTGGNHAEGHGPTTAPHRTPSTAATSGRPTPPPGRPTLPPGHVEPLVGPWHAQLIRRIGIVQGGIASNGKWLYAQALGKLVRISPQTGRIVARTSVGNLTAFVVTEQKVWVLQQEGSGLVVLDQYSSRTLAKLGSTQLGVSPEGDGEFSVAAADGQIYATAGQSVVVVDAASGQIVRRLPIHDGRPSQVAVSPDGSLMYVTVSTPAEDVLQERALPSGRLVMSEPQGDRVISLTASQGGVFIQSSGGMQISVWFLPAHKSDRGATQPEGSGGGGVEVPVTVSHGVVWVGAFTVSCVDPVTGQQRAEARVPGVHGDLAYLGNVVFARGSAYADYHRDRLIAIVRLRPPAACFH